MTAYQANFAYHHTCVHHILENNYLFHIFLSSSHNITKLQPSDTNISTHTQLKFQNFPWSKSKVQAIFFFYIPRCTTGHQELLQNCACVSAYRVVQTFYPMHTVNEPYATLKHAVRCSECKRPKIMHARYIRVFLHPQSKLVAGCE